MALPAKPTAKPESAAVAPDASRVAAEVLSVVPDVMNAIRMGMRGNLDAGLSVPQFRCLGFIGRHAACSISDVAGFLGVTLATASSMVDRLVRAHYVSPTTAQADRRRTELRLSAEGKSLLDGIRRGARADLAKTLSDASPAELAVVMQGLAILKARFVHD
ncbi:MULTISPECIES: MarR family winged helix-turn-helix transcriptional regulator [unclassified Rhizobacter]|uniref:MarR family winged helix-turn-helix transcriptional regulator n=1 Tax=unclassified Rhizobacter TaxID=2640088 RepID=UPI0006F4DCF4|nr:MULTISPECIES: MarR family winged helix-turn-helix transcriptional regulator [unclassified Rhizobacter]KQU80771.1 hypothetical protein ASC88_14530 [Rhizobacter sp. Root29]KQW04314.1 hypothetical protein ASC98_04220 [Rhizobacter sp. Root1238]KRB14553.1 hypothetical protein ASE08_08915 [Rhizobacter sp. Root16D2]